MSDEWMQHYRLDGKTVVPCDRETWSREFKETDRRIARDEIGEAVISTVFLGLNHNWGNGPPLLFETMVFGGALDGETTRYATWEEAEAGHLVMVGRVRTGDLTVVQGADHE